MRQINYLKAISEALHQEMIKNPDIFVMGEDVRQGLRGITKGFLEEFGPDRIIDTPLSEAGFTGCGTGAAIAGMRPVLEYLISEFVFFAFDQLVNHAQKIHYMSGGKLKVPVTYIIPGSGARAGLAGQHSDNPYPYLIHAGMKVVMPSTPYDAKGLLISSIRDDDPVVVFLPAQLLAAKGDVPEEEYEIAIGKGEIKKEGKDITVVAVGHLVPVALKVAEKLLDEGISVEVYDPRTLMPFDKVLLKKSIEKTGRIVVIDESNRTCGFGAEVAAIAADECFYELKYPVKRIARADVPFPFSLPMENYVLPDEEKLMNIIHQIFK